MASRMDRYYKTELISKERSSKNRSLYEEMDDLSKYSNIEGVASIQNSNEIDIDKVKEMLKNSENYGNQKRYERLLREEETSENKSLDNTRSYDINSALSKIKKNDLNDEYRKLDSEQYNALKTVKNKNLGFDIEKEEQELKELIHTLYASKTEIQNKLNNTSFESNDVGLLDDLKSNTVVGDAASIKSIIEEEKNSSKDEEEAIDNSFYTKSFGFTSSDFEELKDINHKIKKSNRYIIILLVVLIVAVLVALFVILAPKFLNFNFKTYY